MNEKMSASALNAAIDKWGHDGKQWLIQGQKLAMAALQHIVDSGDDGFMNRLFLAMPKGTKTSAMAQWILGNSHLRANDDEGTKKTRPFVKDAEKKNNLETAAKKPWYEYAPEPAVEEVYDFQKALLAFLKSAKGKQSKAKQVVNVDLMAQVEALAGVDDAAGFGDALAGVGSAPM
jgi:hypothetical protein